MWSRRIRGSYLVAFWAWNEQGGEDIRPVFPAVSSTRPPPHDARLVEQGRDRPAAHRGEQQVLGGREGSRQQRRGLCREGHGPAIHRLERVRQEGRAGRDELGSPVTARRRATRGEWPVPKTSPGTFLGAA